MKTAFAKTAAAFLRAALSARYRVEIRGAEHLSGPAPVLVLPNHVALIDPVILSSFFAPERILSPLVSETYYRVPAFRPLFDLVSAVPIADVQRGGAHE